MNLRSFLSITLIFFTLTISLTGRVTAEEAKELSITGGLLYRTWAESHTSLTCALTIKTPSEVPKGRYPVQVVCVIDASLKMEGAAIQQAKASAKGVLDLLSDEDMFGLVTYSQYARELFPLKPLNPNNRRNALNAVSRIKYERGRNLSEGMKKGAEQFGKYKGLRSSGQYMLIITNGDPDKGITDPAKLISSAKALAKKNSFHITTVGYDRFFDENMLIALAEKTGGRAYFMAEENIGDMTKIVSREIKRITETSVQKVTIEIITPSGSTIEKVCGGTQEGDNIILGTLQADLKKIIIFDIAGRPSKRKDLEINISHVEPIRMTSRNSRIYLDIPIGSEDPKYDEKFAPIILDFLIQRGLSERIEQIRNNENQVRKDFADLFKETVKKLEQDNVVLQSEYLAKKVEDFKQVQRDIENGAIEDNLLTKRIKYSFLALTYGAPIEE